MDERTLRVLEFDKIQKALEERCATELAKELVRALLPSANLEEVQRRLKELPMRSEGWKGLACRHWAE